MKAYALVNKTTGDIIRSGFCADDSFDLQLRDATTQVLKELPLDSQVHDGTHKWDLVADSPRLKLPSEVPVDPLQSLVAKLNAKST